MLRRLVPFVVGFDLMVSDPLSMPQSGARGQNLGHLIFLESFVFEQHVHVRSLCDFRP